jgi:hypothetical protein
MAVRLSALSTGHTLLPRNIIFLPLVLIPVRGWNKLQGPVWLERLGRLKKFIHLIRSQTCDLPAFLITGFKVLVNWSMIF